jgi:phosphoribosylglycinamide formyltransferase-1
VAIIPGDTADTWPDACCLPSISFMRCLAELVTRPYRADWLLAQVSQLAAALPEVEARESHGAPAWSIKGGKFFAYFNDQHHGEPHIALLVKTSGQDEMNALIDADPDAWFRPAYYGASGWAGLILNRADVDWDQVGEWLARSWRSVAPEADQADGCGGSVLNGVEGRS